MVRLGTVRRCCCGRGATSSDERSGAEMENVDSESGCWAQRSARVQHLRARASTIYGSVWCRTRTRNAFDRGRESRAHEPPLCGGSAARLACVDAGTEIEAQSRRRALTSDRSRVARALN